MGKDIEIGCGIGHESTIYEDDSMKVLVLETHTEDSEDMKYVDDNIIDETQGK